MKSDNFELSIITVTFNSSKTIIDTLNSLISQTYDCFEYIVVDGNSTDNTIEIIKSYNLPNFKYIVEKDNGIYDAMNKGIKLATGKYIGILNSDDIYSSTKTLEIVIQNIKRYKSDSFYGNLVYTSNMDFSKVIRVWNAKKYDRKNFLYGWMPPHPTFFVKKDIYIKNGFFNLNLPTAADYELMLRFLYKYNISCTYIDEIIVKMRSGGISNSSLSSIVKGNLQDRKAWKINNLKPYPFTLLLKPISKIFQFLKSSK